MTTTDPRLLALGEIKARILGRLTKTGYGEYVLVDDVDELIDELADELVAAGRTRS